MFGKHICNKIKEKKVFGISFFDRPQTVRVVFEDGSHLDIVCRIPNDELFLQYQETLLPLDN